MMRFICRNGLRHHAAMNTSHCAGTLAEAMTNSASWNPMISWLRHMVAFRTAA